MTVQYIEDRITELEDRVSTLEDIIEADGEKLDRLADRFRKLYKEVTEKTATKPQVQQTTEEFVRIVRCKDCKWYIKDTTDPYIFDCCNEDGLFHPSDDDYCSEGEKK